MSFLDKFRYKKTNFISGGLRVSTLLERFYTDNIEIPKVFVAPKKIDSRDMCISSNSQNTPYNCAGYSTAGYIEYYNWKTKHYPEQIDGDIIYKRAKEKFDYNKSEGTTLIATTNAAIDLGLINGVPKLLDYKGMLGEEDIKVSAEMSIKFGLHEYGVVMAGFFITNEWNYVNKETGIIKNLGDDAEVRGGHAVLLCGYDSNGVYIQNSWGDWGHYGFAILGWEQFRRQLMTAMIIDTKS